MGARTYVCNLKKTLAMGLSTLGAEYKGKTIHFNDGLFTTDDPRIQALIERNDQFGTSIHWQDAVHAMEARNLQSSEEQANAKARERARLQQEWADEDAAEQAEKDRVRKSEQDAEDRKAEGERLAERKRLKDEEEMREKLNSLTPLEQAPIDASTAAFIGSPTERVTGEATEGPVADDLEFTRPVIEPVKGQKGKR